MRDFTLNIYKSLLVELIKTNYRFMTFAEFVQEPDKKEKAIILRHDVDRKPLRSLRTAEIEKELGLKGTYYFRVVKNELPVDVIKRIAKLGHEIGYHYDDLNAAGGALGKALEFFQKNLAKLREIAQVETACMHGSPLARFDNRELWENKNYREFGIKGEPYFDVDFSEVMYLTDTGRRWDGEKVNIRDKVRGNGLGVRGKKEEGGGQRLEVRGEREKRGQKKDNREEKESRGAVCSPGGTDQSDPPTYADDWCCDPPVLRLHSTVDILLALKKDLLPDKIMLTIHPQRWNDQWLPWIWELGWQKVKNVVKYFIVRSNS